MSLEDGKEISNSLVTVQDTKHQRGGVNMSKSARLGYLTRAGELV